jgi:hypothetical protein
LKTLLSTTPARYGFALLALFLLFVTLPTPTSSPVWLHGVLAVGVMPLILAAMLYFSPVLTRSASPAPRWHALPLLALLAGLLAVAALGQWLWLLVVAIPVALAASALLFFWMWQQASHALGGPHPGLRWYQAALLMLMLALLIIALVLLWPEQWLLWRTVHRQLNLCGFVGLSAIGTLQVLLPTVAAYPDPMAGKRLRQDLPFALLATLLLVLAGVWGLPFAVPGVALWFGLLFRLLQPLLLQRARLTAGGATLLLLGAVLGFAVTLASSLWHEGQVALPLFFALFLLPLLSGALAHMLPLWWWPGLPTPRRHAAQQRLGEGALWRLILCWLAAGAFSLHVSWGLSLLAIPLLWLLVRIIILLLPSES